MATCWEAGFGGRGEEMAGPTRPKAGTVELMGWHSASGASPSAPCTRCDCPIRLKPQGWTRLGSFQSVHKP